MTHSLQAGYLGRNILLEAGVLRATCASGGPRGLGNCSPTDALLRAWMSAFLLSLWGASAAQWGSQQGFALDLGAGGSTDPASACLPAAALPSKKEGGFSQDLPFQLPLPSVRTCFSLGGTDIRKDTPFTEDPSLCPWVPWTATPSNTQPTNPTSVGGGGWQSGFTRVYPSAGQVLEETLTLFFPQAYQEGQTVRHENAP